MQQRQRKQYILGNFLFSNDDDAIGDQDSVRGAGPDSTGIFEFAIFIEEEFRIAIAPEEMAPDHFDTPDVMDAFITRKLAG